MLFFHAQASQCETTVTVSTYEKPLYFASTRPEIREFPNSADPGIFCFITGHSQYTCDLYTLRSAIEMPKQKASTASRLRQYVTQFGENVFSTDGTILFCKVWEVKKHLRGLGNVNKRKVSQLLLKETEVCLFSNFHIFL